MTQEEKQLLLKDLCARLPYRVICDMWFEGNEPDKITEVLKCGGLMRLMNSEFNFMVKPYLRPMSSMTEEEKDELYTAMDWYGEIDESGNVYTKGQEKVYRETFYEYTDWLNAHHFDYRGLIEKGLALEAPEGMYK